MMENTRRAIFADGCNLIFRYALQTVAAGSANDWDAPHSLVALGAASTPTEYCPRQWGYDPFTRTDRRAGCARLGSGSQLARGRCGHPSRVRHPESAIMAKHWGPVLRLVARRAAVLVYEREIS